MIGKTIERDGKLYIAVMGEGTMAFYLTTTDLPTFKRVYPNMLGEQATDQTGVSMTWRGSKSSVNYIVPKTEPDFVEQREAEANLQTKPFKAPTEAAQPKPIIEAVKSIPIEEMPQDEADLPIAMKKKITRQRHKKRVK